MYIYMSMRVVVFVTMGVGVGTIVKCGTLKELFAPIAIEFTWFNIFCCHLLVIIFGYCLVVL